MCGHMRRMLLTVFLLMLLSIEIEGGNDWYATIYNGRDRGDIKIKNSTKNHCWYLKDFKRDTEINRGSYRRLHSEEKNTLFTECRKKDKFMTFKMEFSDAPTYKFTFNHVYSKNNACYVKYKLEYGDKFAETNKIYISCKNKIYLDIKVKGHGHNVKIKVTQRSADQTATRFENGMLNEEYNEEAEENIGEYGPSTYSDKYGIGVEKVMVNEEDQPNFENYVIDT